MSNLKQIHDNLFNRNNNYSEKSEIRRKKIAQLNALLKVIKEIKEGKYNENDCVVEYGITSNQTKSKLIKMRGLSSIERRNRSSIPSPKEEEKIIRIILYER